MWKRLLNIFYETKTKILTKKKENCVNLKANRFHCASKRLQKNIELTLLSLRRGVSIFILGNRLRNEKKLGLTAVEVNPKRFQILVGTPEIKLMFLKELLKVVKTSGGMQVNDLEKHD